MAFIPDKVIQLIEKGVKIPHPFSIEIGDDVLTERISGDGVVLHQGTRIYGAKTIISPGVRLGYEAPVTVVDCQLGSEVELKGGFFQTSVFLQKASMGSGAQIREGCILEEEASGAHTVGLKQTILFPFVTLGSLINFCDCLMAGGTSRRDHSEVGSSYIHFNYTPHQDKATPSLMGDVSRGVMLKQPPIFLGGQGGLIGPARIGYGTVIAAGIICRQDFPESGRILTHGGEERRGHPFHPGVYGDIRRKVYNNICYLANLLALRQWYVHVRQPFFLTQPFGAALYEGTLDKLRMTIEERLNRLGAFAEKMQNSIAGNEAFKRHDGEVWIRQQKEFHDHWPDVKACFTEGHESHIDEKNRSSFVKCIFGETGNQGGNYPSTIQSLDNRTSGLGTLWLQNIVDQIRDMALSHVPSCL